MTRRRRLAVGFAVVAATLTVAFAADLLGELGFTEQAARERIFYAFVDGSVSPSGKVAVFKGADPGKKVLFVQTVTSFAKTFAQTDQFRKMYADYREANKPGAASASETQGYDEMMSAQAKEFEKSLAAMKEVMKSLPPDQQKEMQKTIEEMREQMAAQAKDPEMKAVYEQGTKAQAAADAEDLKRRMKEWEAEFPANPDQLIASRLREFLAETKDIDYGAKLVARSGRQYFANEAYEEKSPEWKMCFRAGKEATGAARAFAAEWLKELQAKGVR
jgi:hypothetical protein